MAERPRIFNGRGMIGVAILITVCIVGAVFFFKGPLANPGQASAPSSPGPAFDVPGEPITGPADKPMTWYQYSGQGTITVRSVRWERTGSQPPSAGKRYLVLDMEITGTAGSLTVNPLYLSAIDKNGEEAFLATMSGYEPELQKVSLQSGQGIRATASFDIAPGDTKIIFTDELLDPIAVLEVPAPR